MQIDWHSSQNPFEAGISLDVDHSEMLALIAEVTKGGNSLANLLDNALKGKDFSSSLRVLLVEAVRGIFTTQTQRILDTDKGNGVLAEEPLYLTPSTCLLQWLPIVCGTKAMR